MFDRTASHRQNGTAKSARHSLIGLEGQNVTLARTLEWAVRGSDCRMHSSIFAIDAMCDSNAACKIEATVL